MANFKDAKVGDKVYSLRFGDLTIIAIRDKEKYPILCNDNDGDQWSYNYSGYYTEGGLTPDLYWNKPEIIEKPRIVEVEETVWLNPEYLNGNAQSFRRKDPQDYMFTLKAKLIYKIER